MPAAVRWDETANPIIDVAQMEIDGCHYGFYIARHRHRLIKNNAKVFDGRRLSDGAISNLNREKVDVVIG